MDPKEQLRQVEEEMARDEAEAKRLSQTDAAGVKQPPTGRSISSRGSSGSGKRQSKGRVYWLAVFMLLISGALAFSRGMSDKDLERLQKRFRRLAQSRDQSPEDRQDWSALQQLVMAAIGALRSQELIKVGEQQSSFRRIRQDIASNAPAAIRAALAEVDDADSIVGKIRFDEHGQNEVAQITKTSMHDPPPKPPMTAAHPAYETAL